MAKAEVATDLHLIVKYFGSGGKAAVAAATATSPVTKTATKVLPVQASRMSAGPDGGRQYCRAPAASAKLQYQTAGFATAGLYISNGDSH
ncbi:hypothetical protein WJX72_003235 [[Myrmecia] bisecta]|uniref:Uncharacterized protein n=1 Tax=[Myrmecia] bisecta TaxID=41462 RepID=A0AAW1Q034_9CHLO